MGLAEEALKTNERRAYGLVEALFNQVSVGGDDEDFIMEQQSIRADLIPMLKGGAAGMADFMAKLKLEGRITDEKANNLMTGFEMARILVSTCIEME